MKVPQKIKKWIKDNFHLHNYIYYLEDNTELKRKCKKCDKEQYWFVRWVNCNRR